MSRITDWLLGQRLVVLVVTGLLIFAGLVTAPFDWDLGSVPRSPVPVDAIPDYGEAQQIVFTDWPGRSPQDVEDQVTYPLTVKLLGVPGVRTVRSTSMFGASFINVLLEDGVDFYWGRSRLLEKLASLPPGLLPEGVRPALGPDATALGQVYWYTLEGRDPDGKPVGGWSLAELRSVQDFLVAPALNSASGISEVASVGGYVREYQIDVDPGALERYGLRLDQVISAVAASNRDVGARTIGINQVEYTIRGLGRVEDLADLGKIAVTAVDGVPVRVTDIGTVHMGPALRRGALDKDGAEAVGGVAVVRYGENPLSAIHALEERVAELTPGLPERVLEDGTVSKVTIVPFYNRLELIGETLDTLESALTDELLVTLLVILVMLLNLRSSFLVAGLLPLAVLMTFVAMRLFGVDANILALSGIAIAIGTMVDMAIVVIENIVQHIETAPPDEPRTVTVARATGEVAGAVVTAVATTVVSFMPVFALQAAEGKLFRPLAWTKTLALVASLIVALAVLPTVASMAWPRLSRLRLRIPAWPPALRVSISLAAALTAGWLLARHWMPLGLGETELRNTIFVVVFAVLLLGGLRLFQAAYPWLLRLALSHKLLFCLLPATLVLAGLTAWLGAPKTLGWLPDSLTQGAREKMPGLESEFMPRLDEGSFLFMPSTMPHASIGATLDALQHIDRAIASIPEVEHAVGKLGRADSALDPAPVSMIETVVTLRPEWGKDEDGERVRLWRPEILTPSDIWDEVVRVARAPELTSAPPLQPIETRIVMLQTGMRASMGVKVRGPDLPTLERFGLAAERIIEGVEGVAPGSVLADRLVAKPYLEIRPDRDAIARYGLTIDDLQRTIEVAIGGKPLSRTIEGRESYPIRIRYPPELRQSPEDLEAIRISTPSGAQIPLRELASLEYARGPQMIRGEDTFKTAHVTFGKVRGAAETTVVEAARDALKAAIDSGELEQPPGITWRMAGTWEAKVRSDERLSVLIPIALVLVYLLLHLQFRSTATTLMVFSGVAVAVAGGFLTVWAWGQPGFLDFAIFGHDLRDVFHVGQVNISVAVWVGFIALIGIATDDGVVMATYLDQRFRTNPPTTAAEVTEAVVDAGRRRIRPCLMTTATTVIALLPVLSSSGRGADVMIPMAIPAFGGMAFELLTLFVVPVLYGGWHTLRLQARALTETPPPPPPAASQLDLPLAAPERAAPEEVTS